MLCYFVAIEEKGSDYRHKIVTYSHDREKGNTREKQRLYICVCEVKKIGYHRFQKLKEYIFSNFPLFYLHGNSTDFCS